jgi:site-specific recombinase XerD
MHLYKRENGIWYLKYIDDNGKIQRISTCERIKSKAFKYLITYTPTPKQEKTRKIILSEFNSEYLEYANAAMTKRSICHVKHALSYLITQFGDLPLDKINSIMLEKNLLEYFTRTKHGAFHVYRTLKSAFNKAKKWKYLKVNPFDEFRLPKIPKKLPVFINEKEFELILEKITRKRIYQISLTAFYTGMRLSEVLHLTWEQVDLDNRMINLTNSESFITKSKKPRSIPMCQKVFDLFCILKSDYRPNYQVKENIVFYKIYGIPYSKNYLSHYFKDAVDKTALRQGIKFHTLRHSFASMLVSKGVSLYVVKELLGHSDFATTQIYAHLESKSLKDAIEKLNN